VCLAGRLRQAVRRRDHQNIMTMFNDETAPITDADDSILERRERGISIPVIRHRSHVE
jgi:hypothetical protein